MANQKTRRWETAPAVRDRVPPVPVPAGKSASVPVQASRAPKRPARLPQVERSREPPTSSTPSKQAVTVPLLTFREKVESIVRLCHTILAKHGEPCSKIDRAVPGFYRGGYRFPAHVESGSEPDYALKILWTLNIALRATDLDEARKYAWDAAHLIFDAHVVFKGKRTALHAAHLAGQTHAIRARLARHGAHWQWAIDHRPPGRSKRAVIQELADRDGVQPDSIERQLRRLARREKNHSPRKK